MGKKKKALYEVIERFGNQVFLNLFYNESLY